MRQHVPSFASVVAGSVDAASALAAPSGRLILLGVGLVLAGCSTQREGQPDPIVRHEIITTLAQGQLRLDCDLACVASWRQARPTLKGLHHNDLWADLATEVARVGHRVDLGYFYLARAAEGLGHPAAAINYHRLALASPRSCDGLVLDSCDGISVPAQSRAALERLTGQRMTPLPAAVPAAPAGKEAAKEPQP